MMNEDHLNHAINNLPSPDRRSLIHPQRIYKKIPSDHKSIFFIIKTVDLDLHLLIRKSNLTD